MISNEILHIRARFGSVEESAIATELLAARQLATAVKERHVDQHASGYDEICEAYDRYEKSVPR